ncbi:hypothetical protein P4475_14820 [Halalkalibacterium halodurans]|uniref:Uncharacterized protein n=1 Tax=Halalkalibacterium halodurans TaxID=86665 RepID=A0A0M0KL56_ALKHA|nr:hypothetical protein [Halalkalibacterium halodurans]MDY7221972.1 hypothetical protein [Halalkalibacterium halodurans]MDY7241248.1 hypothetical protein [Halalkalibacterium halodurans]MED3648057.1 hypothetical protein [Halalkalibacterium halodurans]MED4163332.1 hypothetical protein [Halalkalibacterium halodurans]TES54996.1 hypothetical protein E2L07_08085 [Halalkalibacterium halodurans]
MGKRNTMNDFYDHKLTPQKIAVIIGLVTDALQVQAILVDANQRVEIVLEGHLSKKSEMDRMMDDLSDMKFGEVMDAFMKRK